VKDGLADMSWVIGCKAGGYGIAFIVHRLKLRIIENEYEPEDCIKISEFNAVLDSLGSATFEYGSLYEDERKERVERYKAEEAIERVELRKQEEALELEEWHQELKRCRRKLLASIGE